MRTYFSAATLASVATSGLAFSQKQELPIVFVADAETQQVYRLRDWDNNFDYDTNFLDETIVFYDSTLGTIPLVEPVSITSSPNDFLFVGDIGAGRVVAMEDLDDNGDCHGSGEHFVFFDGDPAQNASGIRMSRPMGVVSVALDEVWVANAALVPGEEDTILRLADLDGDGVANGFGEARVFHTIPSSLAGDSIPMAVELLVNGDVLYLENGTTGAHTKGVYRLRDVDNDGVIDPVSEVFTYFLPPNAVDLTALDVTREQADFDEVVFVLDRGAGRVWRLFDQNLNGTIDAGEASLWWSGSATSDLFDLAVTQDEAALLPASVTPDRVDHLFDRDGNGTVDSTQLEQRRVYDSQVNQVVMRRARGIDIDFHGHEEVGEHVCAGSALPCPCSNPAQGDEEGCANSTGRGAILEGEGTTSVSLDDLEFHALGLPPNTLTILFVGSDVLNGGAGIILWDGIYCVGGASRRIAISQADGAGGASFGPGLGAIGGWLVGEQRVFQAVYRDAIGPACGGLPVNATSAVQLTFTP